MKNLTRTILIQWLAFGLIWNPAYAQEAGSATKDIADQYKYKDFIHQASVDKAAEECAKNNCENPGSGQNGIDVVNSFVAKTAMGLLVGGGIASLLKGDAFSLTGR